MLSLKNSRHKRLLINAFSSCFSAIKDELGNVPLNMQKSHEIAGSIVGICRGFAIRNKINEPSFELIVDAVFEDVFRRESLTVQTRAEKWLKTADETFMFAYYHGKTKALNARQVDLSWLADYAKKHFKRRQSHHRQSALPI